MFSTFLSVSFLWSHSTFLSKSTALKSTVGSSESSLFGFCFFFFPEGVHVSLGVLLHNFYMLLLSPDHTHSFLRALPACAGLVGDLVPLPAGQQSTANWGSPEWQPFTADLKVAESNHRSRNTSTYTSSTGINVPSNVSAIPFHQFSHDHVSVWSSLQVCARSPLTFVPSSSW